MSSLMLISRVSLGASVYFFSQTTAGLRWTLLRRRPFGESLSCCHGPHLLQKVRSGHAAVFLGEGIAGIGNDHRALAGFHNGVAVFHVPFENAFAISLRVGRKRSRTRDRDQE